MRRAPIVAVSCALVGCAALSGLDQLTVGEADATAPDAGDAALDVTPPLDAGNDVTADVTTPCPYTLGALQCFQTACNDPCCVTALPISCTTLCGTNSVPIGCTSPADCDAGAPTCCLQSFLGPAAGCPLVFAPGDGGIATACTKNDGCAGASHQRLCTTSADCPSGQICLEGAISINTSKIFGVCR